MFGKIDETVLLCNLNRFKMRQVLHVHNTVSGIALLQTFSCDKTNTIYVDQLTIFFCFVQSAYRTLSKEMNSTFVFSN